MISDRVSILRAKGQGGANSAGHRTSYVSIKKHEGNLRMLPPSTFLLRMLIRSDITCPLYPRNSQMIKVGGSCDIWSGQYSKGEWARGGIQRFSHRLRLIGNAFCRALFCRTCGIWTRFCGHCLSSERMVKQTNKSVRNQTKPIKQFHQQSHRISHAHRSK